MDTTEYQPVPHVLDRLKDVSFLAVIGPTAVGKSTLINAAMALDPALHLVLNNTSRLPRAGERDGVDYQFQSREFMEARIARGEYVQVAPSVLGELYATPPEGYSIKGIALMAVLAEAMPLFRSLPFKSIRSVFILPPDWPTWEQRLNAHGFTPEQRAKRLAEAERSLRFALEDQETHLLINRDLAAATKEFIAVARDKSLPAQATNQAEARQVVRELLQALGAGKTGANTV